MSEQIGVVLIFAGLGLLVAGLVSLAIRGIPVLLGRGSARRLRWSLALIAGGLVVGAVPFVWQEAYLAIVGLGPRERIVEGSPAVVLTGWDRDDDSFLAERPGMKILEMATPEVTDATLDLLAALPRLKELTLNDAQLTDAGLAKLAVMPALEILRIARTDVTADGMKAFLAEPSPRLAQLDVSGCGIPTSTLRAWKNAAPSGSGSTPGCSRWATHRAGWV
jgi:hypothetical protein